jgi:hypothetical protein
MSILEFLNGNTGIGLVIEEGVLLGKEDSVFSNSELRNKL